MLMDTFKRYKFKSGMIFYDIKISSFDNSLNSQVQGISRLVFDDWGAREIKEEDLAEVQSGNFDDSRVRHTINKIDYGAIYSVDFDENIIYKTRDRDLDLAIAQKLDLSDEPIRALKETGAKKVGKDIVANVECDIWQYKDQQICLHKAIPLKVIIKNAGFFSEKTAVQVILDKSISNKEFLLPKFKILEDDEYTSAI